MTIMSYPINLDRLRELLRTEPLDSTFERFGNFVIRNPMLAFKPPRLAYPDNPAMVHFFGNFANYSFVFSFNTDEQGLIDEMEALIRANQAMPEYAEHKIAEAKREAYWIEYQENQRRQRRIDRIGAAAFLAEQEGK